MSENILDFDAFFVPLVGTPEKTQVFHNRLVGAVRNEQHDSALPDDPYLRLRAGLMAVVAERAPAMVIRSVGRDFNERVENNINNGGTELTVQALRAIGGWYARNARDKSGELIPQRRSGVERDVAHALGFMLSLANRDNWAASVTANSIMLGYNPHRVDSRWHRVMARVKRFVGLQPYPDGLDYAFAATQPDVEGQIRVSPKYRPLPATNERRCPALGERLPDGRHSLWEYVNVIGDVAINEIFQHQFPIIDDAEPREASCPAPPVAA
ncbi:MAG TPA: hypothetical protein VLF40_05160 [Candidatus Saccharimonadales bacterium]|nr:hypothetical protein [Candidatus Saccharimonadales bacterium]